MFGDYIGKINNGNDNFEHHPFESYVASWPLCLQQCPLSQDLHNSHPLSCSLGTNESYSPISENSNTSGFHPFDASVENLHFGNAEILNGVALERKDRYSEELLLEDIFNDSSISNLEIEDSHWRELVREFDSAKDSNKNGRLNSHLVNVKKGFALNCDSTSYQEQQYIDSKHKHDLNIDNNFTDTYLLGIAEPNFTATSQNSHPCQSNADEDLFQFISKSPLSYIECRDIVHYSPCLDVYNSHRATRPNTDMTLGSHLKRRRHSDYGGCENHEDDLLLAHGLDSISQRSHLRRKFSFRHGFESTQRYRFESQTDASLNFDSSKAGKRQAVTAINITSDEFPCALSVRNASANHSSGNVHAGQDSRDNYSLDDVLPQLPFSLPPVPAEYQLVITHQSVPATNNAVQQQLTQIIMTNPSLATEKEKKSVSKFKKMFESLANEQSCATLREKRNAEIISPSNSESDLSQEICSPTAHTIPFEKRTTTGIFQELSCQSSGTGCVYSSFPYSSSSLSEPNFDHKLGEVLNMSRPASSEIYKNNCGCSDTGALLTSSPLSASLAVRSGSMSSLKPTQRLQNLPVSPDVLFLSKLPLTTECKRKCSLTVSTDSTRNDFASAGEQNTSPSLMPVLLPHAFIGAPTVHSRSDLTGLVNGIFPPNAVIVSEKRIPRLNTRSSLTCTDKVLLTSEVPPISLPGLSTNRLVMPSPASNRKSSFSSFQMSAASPSLNNTRENLQDKSKINQVKACSPEAAVSTFTSESVSSGCPEKTCSLPSSGFQSSATLFSPECSYAQFSGVNLCQSQQKATVFDCKSSGTAQLQEQSILFCASEGTESAEDSSWNSTDGRMYSIVTCDPKMTGPSSLLSPDVLVSQGSSKDCGCTCESEHKVTYL